jgi:hypothetical protein
VAVKLHRCSLVWLKTWGHPCWRVQKALDERGIDYEIAQHSNWDKWRRRELVRVSGQKRLPVIEFADGSVYRGQSKDMAATIRAGKLDEKRGAAAPSG